MRGITTIQAEEVVASPVFDLIHRYMSGIAMDCPGMSHVPYLTTS